MLDNPENSEIELQPTTDVNSSIDSEQFLQNLKKSGNQYIGIQSVLDALDLWNSSIKLYFDAVDYKTSTDALNAWLSSPIGATCFFLGAVLLSTFAYLGNGIAKSPTQSELSKQADTYWPYLRDMLKGMKWTFKGTRSVMIVASVLGQYQLINYLTPVGLGLGMLSACNRIWNRSMVEARKSLQEQNDAFRRQIKGIHACFHEVTRDLVWDESGEPRQEILENIYAGSILKVPNANGVDYYHVNAQGVLTDISAQMLEHHWFIKTLNEELDRIRDSLPGQKIVPRIYWDKFEHFLIQEQSCPDIFKTILKEKKQHLEKVLDPNSTVYAFIQNRAAFQTNARKGFASATFSGLVNAPYYFLGLLSMVTLSHTIFIAAVSVCSLFMLLNIAAELYQETDYQRRLRISQLKASLVKTKRLLVIEWQHANLDPGLIPSQQVNDSPLLQQIKNIQGLLKDERLSQILISMQSEDGRTRPKVDDYLEICDGIDKDLYGDLSVTQKTILKHCIKIAKYEQDYRQQNKELNEQLRLSKGSIWWQGLRNGLVVFGTFNSLLMSLATIKLLLGIDLLCGIGSFQQLFYVSIIAGLAIIFFTTLYTLLSIDPNEDNTAEDQDIPSQVDSFFVAASTKKCIDDKDIQASKNLLISEHSEVFRQSMSGFKKGAKFLQTISVFIFPLRNNDSILTNVCYIGTGFVFSIFFALKGLRGLMRVDEAAYKNSFLYQGLSGRRESEKTPIQAMPKIKRVPSIFGPTQELLRHRASPPPHGLVIN